MEQLKRSLIGGAAALALSATAAAAETWDMPMAYPDSNFHSQNGKAFAECVAAGTDGAQEHQRARLLQGDDQEEQPGHQRDDEPVEQEDHLERLAHLGHPGGLVRRLGARERVGLGRRVVDAVGEGVGLDPVARPPVGTRQ